MKHIVSYRCVRVGKEWEGLGSDVKTIQRMCADDAETLDLIDSALKNPNGVHHAVDIINAIKPDGTSRQAALRSLRKNAPAIHKEVISGKLSAHAGMLKAALRRIESEQFTVTRATYPLPLYRRKQSCRVTLILLPSFVPCIATC